MPNFTLLKKINLSEIYQGGLLFLDRSHLSEELCVHATNIVQEVFQTPINEVKTDESTSVKLFIDKAKKIKNIFTNDDKTKKLLKNLILERYENNNLLYDVPRIRIVPNSKFLSAGISYNYKPHRDTWYGGGQDQINHWMALSGVTENSTFYIAPTYFNREINNNSEIFDLDEWDSKYRSLAETNVNVETRPHPIPLVDLDERDRFNIVIPRGAEVVFSGHHLHGSAENKNTIVRFSIDYRVCELNTNHSLPTNVDSRATGNYKNYMFPVD